MALNDRSNYAIKLMKPMRYNLIAKARTAAKWGEAVPLDRLFMLRSAGIYVVASCEAEAQKCRDLIEDVLRQE